MVDDKYALVKRDRIHTSIQIENIQTIDKKIQVLAK